MPANTLIAIKRSQSTAAPVALANGELAYSFSSDKLFIGQTANSSVATTVEYIGGKLAMDKIANLESIVISGSSIHADVTVSSTMTLSSATNNSVLIAKTGGLVDFVTGTSGKVMQIAANGTPTFDDLNGGTYQIMSYTDAEEVFGLYTKESENQLVEYNKMIIALRTKVTFLENQIKEQNKIPVPRMIVEQIMELEMKNRKLQDDLKFYSPHIPENVKAKRNKQKAPTRKGGLR